MCIYIIHVYILFLCGTILPFPLLSPPFSLPPPLFLLLSLPSSPSCPTQEQAAATVLYCAAHPALADISGLYWYECHPVEPSDVTTDAELGERLWNSSERLITERINSIRDM